MRTTSFFLLTLTIVFPVLGGSCRAEVFWPEPDYPPATRESTPDWLLNQKICFSRWDGGRIESCKGFLSGWTFFNPPWPDVIYATDNWYTRPTVSLAKEMGYNFLWLTFSNGFSHELEKGHWEQLRDYVEECHRQGIRVAAYISSTNMFSDDMLAHVPEAKDWLLLGKDGKPVPYGAANYQKMGRTTRMLADLTHPGWIEYQKKRIDVAIEIGFDALEYDNIWYVVGGSERSKKAYREFLEKNGFEDNPVTENLYKDEVVRHFFRKLLAYARQKKPDMIIFHNTNYPYYTDACSDTIISTEDGKEPGYYSIETYVHEIHGSDLTPPVYEDILDADPKQPFKDSSLVSNLGLLRMLKALDGGWKPVLVEFGGRRNGHRMLNQMPPLAFQLSVAECNAALCSYQGYQEGRALLDLYNRIPEVVPIMKAASEAHRFVTEHQDLILGGEYLSDVAVVLDARLKGRDLLKALARRNIQFEVLLDERVTPEKLKKIQRVLVYHAECLSDRAIQSLVDYANGGGSVFVVGESGSRDLWGQPRSANPLSGSEKIRISTKEPSQEEITEFLTKGVVHRFEVLDNPYVLFTLTKPKKETGDSCIVHLLNYLKKPISGVRVRCKDAEKIRILSLTDGCETIRQTDEKGVWEIPSLGLYTMLVVD